MLKLPASSATFQWWEKHQTLLLRGLIITAVLLISGASSLILPEEYARYILVAPFAVVGALVLLRWPPLGFIGVIIAAMLVNIYVPGFGLTAVLLAALTGLWIIDMVGRKRVISLIRSPTIPPLLLFAATTILAFGVGQFPWYPISPAPMDGQLGGLGIFLLLFCAFLLAAHQIRDERWLKIITFVFLGVAGVGILSAFYPGIRRLILTHFHRKMVGGSLFWTWLTAMTVSQALFNRKLNWRWRFLLGFVVVGIFYIRLVQGRAWSSGWVPAVITIMVIILVGAPRKAMSLLVVGGMALLTSFQYLYNTFILVGDNEYSTLTRLEAWRIVVEIIKVNPVLGLGPANYRFYTPLFPILGWSVQFNSHNNYVDILAQTGILGLVFFIWFLWAVWQTGWRLRSQVPDGGFERAYVYGCLGGLVGTVVAGMLGDWVIPFAYNIGIEGLRASVLAWFFLGGLVSLEQIVSRRDSS